MMRIILLAAGVLALMGCTTPNMRGNGEANVREDGPRTPDVFRKPPKQFGKWGGYGYGERY